MADFEDPYLIGGQYQSNGMPQYIQQDPSGRAYLATLQQPRSFFPSERRAYAPPPKAAPTNKERKMSLEELSKWADDEKSKLEKQSSGAQQTGSSVRPRMSDAEAARLRGEADTMMAAMRSDLGRPTAVSDSLARSRNEQMATPSQQMMNTIEPYAYRYKQGVPGEDPSRQNYGVMAQDLQKTPMGASVVRETPDGKMIDVPKAVGVQFAAQADLQDQINELRKREMGGGQ
jgi:hypothetical protein